MTFRTYAAAATAVSMIALAGCHPAPLKHGRDGDFGFVKGFNDGWADADGTKLKTVSTLVCPDSSGDLHRTAQAADGKSCDYAGPNDETVRLSLVALDGHSPVDALAATKAGMKALLPAIAGAQAVSVDASSQGDGPDRGEHAKVDLPFLHVDANGNKADVQVLGATIHADGDHADIKTDMGMKNTHIHAGPGGAEIVAETVGKSNASLVYMLAGDKIGPAGYRAVGYIARGPAEGPLVVAEFRSKAGHHNSGDHYGVEALLRANLKS